MVSRGCKWFSRPGLKPLVREPTCVITSGVAQLHRGGPVSRGSQWCWEIFFCAATANGRLTMSKAGTFMHQIPHVKRLVLGVRLKAGGEASSTALLCGERSARLGWFGLTGVFGVVELRRRCSQRYPNIVCVFPGKAFDLMLWSCHDGCQERRCPS